DGQPLQPKAAQNLLDAACDRADVTRRTLHRLRHTFASQLLKMGTSLSDVSHFLGHRDVGITSRSYAHFIDDDSTAVQDMASRVLSHAKAGKKDSE
ncbi:MAG TPA: tyrosine-type recombinase/integrase, partial [Candidatus Saccharimonadales bacterium]|nr:tyrosine-type recombinase/integrase [Candidatus Saccharimonadales bacterium]